VKFPQVVCKMQSWQTFSI